MKYEQHTFLGETMSQSQNEFNAWELVLRDKDFSRIIELGTWKGVLSYYLFLFANHRKATFLTFENKKFEMPFQYDLNFIVPIKGAAFVNEDIFKAVKDIKMAIGHPGRTILFCDGGNKAREVRLFAPVLKKGDILVIHDWGVEVDFTKIGIKDFQTKFKKLYLVDRIIFFEKI